MICSVGWGSLLFVRGTNIIAIKMDFRLSRITEHNKNEETDHLYDPLRDTLRKSSVSKGKTLNRVTSAH